MSLKSLKEDKEYFTGKLSDVNRSLAFAGIIIIWVLTMDEQIEAELLLPLLLYVLALFFDLVHYIYYSLVWSLAYRNKEKKVDKQELKGEQVKVSKKKSNWGYVFFFLKVLLVLVAYIILIYKLFQSTLICLF